MALDKYKEYLAAKVLNDGVPVNYRLLSRALKVQSNVAKQMLYEFHRSQTARKPNAVHATYLVTGVRRQAAPDAHAGGDTIMSDGPPMSSLPDAAAEDAENEDESVPVVTMTLVQEEQLQEVRAAYEEIHAIHVYSLEPSTLQNVHVLSDCGRRIIAETASEDPLATWDQYGTIRNPAAKRRTGAGRAASVVQAAPALPKTAAMKPEPSGKPAPEAGRPESAGKPAAAAPSPAAKPAKAGPAGLKRENSSLFKSFAKTPAPRPKLMDAEDNEDEDVPRAAEETAESKAKAEASRAARREQDEQLRKMMEDDQDEPMEDKSSDSEAGEDEDVGNDVGSAEDGGGQTNDAEADVEMQDAKAAPEEVKTETRDGRRRGRRRVMKKKTTKDADGYLVTKQEEAWESFSEDEQPAPARTAAPPRTATPGTGKPASKNSGPKGQQGSIMSFFGKK